MVGVTSAEEARKIVIEVKCQPAQGETVVGLNYENENTIEDIIASFSTSGFQATHLGKAKSIIDEMYRWRLAHENLDDTLRQEAEEIMAKGKAVCTGEKFCWGLPAVRNRTRARVWLSFTSNMMSSGLREAFVYLAKHKLVDVIVTSAGGIEEDFVKCLGGSVVGSFSEIRGEDLRAKGWNRIGNLYVPNANYALFQDWFQPLLDELLAEQKANQVSWTPSMIIHRLGERINNESSLYYWCAKNNIPVFCPGITDGSMGDNIFFHAYRNPGLKIDVVDDIRRINDLGARQKKSGIIILGGGSPKHHVCNANLMKNGADFAVYINTAQEFDGSDSGASPDEAKSWGKIASGSKQYIKVCSDATIAFPLLVETSFKKARKEREAEIKKFQENFSKEEMNMPNSVEENSGYILEALF